MPLGITAIGLTNPSFLKYLEFFFIFKKSSVIQTESRKYLSVIKYLAKEKFYIYISDNGHGY